MYRKRKGKAKFTTTSNSLTSILQKYITIDLEKIKIQDILD